MSFVVSRDRIAEIRAAAERTRQLAANATSKELAASYLRMAADLERLAEIEANDPSAKNTK